MNQENYKKTKTISININQKNYPLIISLSENFINFRIQEKYSLYHYQNKLSHQDFSKLHKYFRFFDNLDEIYEDIIKNNINLKDDIINNKSEIKINFNVNNNNYEINISLNKKELDKIKDIDIILLNYIDEKRIR